MSKEWWKHSASFNAKVTLEAIKGEETVAQLFLRRKDMRPFSKPDSGLEKGLAGRGSRCVRKNHEKHHEVDEALVARLYQHIGQLKVERDFLAEKSGQ